MSTEKQDASNQDQFLWCFSKERRRVFAFIYSLVPDAADAEDIFQQASMSMWKNFDKYDSDREFYPWACGVAHHAVQDFRRSASRRRLLFSDELISQLVDDRMSDAKQMNIRSELLEECLTELKEKDRQLLSQVYFKGGTAAELANATNRSVQTIYNRLNLIRKRLLDCVVRKLAASDR